MRRILNTAELCRPLINCLQKMMLENDYIQADQTTVQVLEEIGEIIRLNLLCGCTEAETFKNQALYSTTMRRVEVITLKRF